MDDGVFDQLRRRATRERRPMKDVVNALLREALKPAKAGHYRFDWKPAKGRGLQPGVSLDDRKSLWDLMDGR